VSVLFLPALMPATQVPRGRSTRVGWVYRAMSA